jgi:putative polyhydroxyalkanoate system protein
MFMKSVSVKRQHNLGRQACIELADQITDKLIARIGGTKQLQGDTIYYKHISGSKGTLVSTECTLEVTVELGFLVRSLGKTIESEINEICDQYLR